MPDSFERKHCAGCAPLGVENSIGTFDPSVAGELPLRTVLASCFETFAFNENAFGQFLFIDDTVRLFR